MKARVESDFDRKSWVLPISWCLNYVCVQFWENIISVMMNLLDEFGRGFFFFFFFGNGSGRLKIWFVGL